MESFIATATSPSFQIAVLVTVMAVATMYTVLTPFLGKDRLKERMAAVTTHRESLRAAHRESFNQKKSAGLRTGPSRGFVTDLVDNLKLLEILDADIARKKLMMAGFRGEGPVFTYMAARIGMPFAAAIVVGVYVYFLSGLEMASLGKLLLTVGGFFAGFYLPNVYLSNVIGKRQKAIQMSWPDALDLLLICVESGMSIEAAFQKVGGEVGKDCPELAEELGLTTAELSYLPERRQAYSNLASRTGLESVKGVVTALVQSEKYGTPLGQSLRVMSDESREFRMQEAEKKAAALPPKLTVPMIGFFLPVLFAVILAPALMQVLGGK